MTASAERALYSVYLPVLLLLPDGYIWGKPEMSLYQYAIIPIGISLCWRFIRGVWRWSLTDFTVAAYLLWTIASGIHANGHIDLLNHVVYAITLGFFPYMAGKLLIEQSGIRDAFIKRFVFFLFLDSLISVFEFRLGINPLRQLFNRLFNAEDQWPTQLRYGFGRASGPFGHSIFMGTVTGIGIMLHKCAEHMGLWEPRFKWFPRLPLNKPQIIQWTLIAACLMTLSRGPMIATLAGLTVVSIGLSKDRWLGLRRAVAILVLGGALAYWGGKAYVSLSQGAESQEEVASAMYRVRLLSEYKEIAMLRSLWGWGDPQWPKVKGMSSIDNWYLLEVLTYGVPGVCLFIGLLLIPGLQMLWVGLSQDILPDDIRALIFFHIAVLCLIAVSISTVFLGSQLFPLLFLFLGWGDACFLSRPSRILETPTFEFRRVIA